MAEQRNLCARDPSTENHERGGRVRGIWNWKVFPNFIPFKPNSFSYRKPPKKLGFLCCAEQPPLRDLLSGGLKNPKFTDDLAKNFGKLEIFESRKLGHLGGCLLSLEEFSSENIFIYICMYIYRENSWFGGRGEIECTNECNESWWKRVVRYLRLDYR